jgi:hypothetical protein
MIKTSSLHRLLNISYFIVLCLFTSQNLKAENTHTLHGYWKSFFLLNVPPNYDNISGIETPETKTALYNTFRLKYFYDSGVKITFNAAYNFSPRWQQSQSDILEFNSISYNSYRVSDINSSLFDNHHGFAIYQNIDRAFAKYEAKNCDIYFGRQAIAWGSAKVINPTDIILPFRFDELDKEERTGVDAVRIRFAKGRSNELDFGIVAGKDFIANNGALFARNKFSLLDTDVSFLLINFSQNLLAGMDISRAIGGAGFWLESAYTFAGYFNDYSKFKENNYFRFTTGLDYNFSSKIYGFIEYHFSDAGKTNTKEYLSNFSAPAFAKGNVFLMGKQYLIPNISYQISPLLNANMSSIINLADNSYFFSPSFEYSLSQNTYISLGAFLGIGKGLEASSSETIFNSEFGSYPNLYFCSLRKYF